MSGKNVNFGDKKIQHKSSFYLNRKASEINKIHAIKMLISK